MPDTDDVVLWDALYRLTMNYWFEVDFNGGGNAYDFYIPDGLFAVCDNLFQGHDQIRAYYAWRQRSGHTTARHLVDNLQVLPADKLHVRLIGVSASTSARYAIPHYPYLNSKS